MPILPDAAADRDQADADPDIRQHVDRALHRVGDREERIFALIQSPNEQNPGGKTDQLHQHLDRGEMADPPRKAKARAARCGGERLTAARAG